MLYSVSINKTSFNGLFQINKHGILTSAFGNVKNPRFYKKEQIEKFSKKLKGVKLTTTRFFRSVCFFGVRCEHKRVKTQLVSLSLSSVSGAIFGFWNRQRNK